MSGQPLVMSGDSRPDVAILGLGASGYAAARLGLTNGETVYVSETRSDASTAARGDELRAFGADVELGGHDLERIAAAGTVVVSPGIPPDAPLLCALRDAEVRWISEPEFAFRFFRSALIAVTGTNGKTTTSVLLAHLLDAGGVKVGLGGNIGAAFGPPASELALLDPAPEWLVVEVSSFQLADIETFRPDIGVITNLAPDHLDRYPSVEAYYADKARIFETANSDSQWVLNGNDRGVIDLAGEAPGERFLFAIDVDSDRTSSLRGSRGRGFVRDGWLQIEIAGEVERLLPLDDLPILGGHNVANALAAALAARVAGVEPVALAKGLRSASPLPHRLEPVSEAGGVLWVNDSKATNVAAAVSAVESLAGRPIVLLAGGKDKGESFAPLALAAGARCKRVLSYGAVGDRLAAELSVAGDFPVERMPNDLAEVVSRAHEIAEAGDVVLLAPACSSFDMFDGYEARGDSFRSLVFALGVSGEGA